MASCSPSIDNFVALDGSLDVIPKYKELMTASLSDESVYNRAKETFFQLFKDLQLSEPEKAQVIAQNISTLAHSISSGAMQQAVVWAKEERDGAYALAKLKAETEVLLATKEKTAEEICVLQKEEELKCAQIEATIAASIRENGRAATYRDAEECRPETLHPEGLKYEQSKLVEAQSYQVHADTYRKSGVVELETDVTDGVYKGKSGNNEGNTYYQTEFTKRQTIAFEDSKRNHAANSASTMISGLLSSETFSTENAQDVERWRAAIDYLNTKSPS